MNLVMRSNSPVGDQPAKRIYKKSQSFDTFVSNIMSDQKVQSQRATRLLKLWLEFTQSFKESEIIKKVLDNLVKDEAQEAEFRLTVPICDELSRITDVNIPRYFFHRYRYDVFPQKRIIDDYPPYLQIELSSVCNFRCIFCYQTDISFTQKDQGYMGVMSFDFFKEIIDQAQGNIEFLSLASRGEPLVCKDIDKMLEYCVGKFLGLKVNTNASLLTEKICHAILMGGVNTIVFSADAAQEPLYSKLRVNGKLQKTLDNIKMFHLIRDKHYPDSKIITRVSGVKFSEAQTMSSMGDVWGSIVDQICFVDYNPWENVYESAVNNMLAPCSDLWRRMFVWFDGNVNPCDVDFKSTLCVGSVKQESISMLWRNDVYENLRKAHLHKGRGTINPCRRCTVI